MGRSKNYLYSLLLLSQFASAEVFEKLPTLISKQTSNNLRFISNDGKFTYYQRSSGGLLLSTNYKVTEFLKGPKDTQYTILASPARRKIIVTSIETLHNFLSLRQEEKIYVMNFGDNSPMPIGSGLSPKLHVGDNWLSFFNPSSQKLNFINTGSSVLKFDVTLTNKINPYFIPSVAMVDDDRIFYTDLNAEGVPAVIDFRRGTARLTPFFKVNSPLQRLELCLGETDLYIGQFGLSRSGLGSSITRYPLKNLMPQEGKVVYQSEKDDLGHIICNYSPERLFFIQNKTQKNDKEYFEAVSLQLGSGEIKTLSAMQFPSQLINMDGTLLLPMNGKLYILEGNNDLVRDSLPKKQEASEVTEEAKK